jgi:hypothetical protein
LTPKRAKGLDRGENPADRGQRRPGNAEHRVAREAKRKAASTDSNSGGAEAAAVVVE